MKDKYFFDLKNKIEFSFYNNDIYFEINKKISIFLLISNKYKKDSIFKFFNKNKINYQNLIFDTKIEINNSNIIIFGDVLDSLIIGKNNRIFIVDFYDEILKLKKTNNNVFYFFYHKIYENIDVNFYYRYNSSYELFDLLGFIIYKIIHNFNFFKTKGLASTRKGRISRFDIQVGSTCPNDCIFCNEGGRKSVQKILTKSEINACKKELLKKEYDYVMLGEREPSISPLFLDVVEMCNDVGINTISVVTGGFRFKYFNFCKIALEKGLNEVRFSLHGSTSNIHDNITNREGSFDQIIEAISNFSLLSNIYTINIIILVVVNKKNLYDLKNILTLIKDYGITRIGFSFVELLGSGYKNRYEVVPRYSEFINEIHNLVDFYKNNKIYEFESLNIENVPYCLVERSFFHYLGMRSINYGLENSEKGLKKQEVRNQYDNKEYLSKCFKCIYINKCEGIHKGYTDIYGEEEFNPVIKDNIVKLDNIKKFDKFNVKIIDLYFINNKINLIRTLIVCNKIGYYNFIIRREFFYKKDLIIIKNKYNLFYYNKV